MKGHNSSLEGTQRAVVIAAEEKGVLAALPSYQCLEDIEDWFAAPTRSYQRWPSSCGPIVGQSTPAPSLCVR